MALAESRYARPHASDDQRSGIDVRFETLHKLKLCLLACALVASLAALLAPAWSELGARREVARVAAVEAGIRNEIAATLPLGRARPKDVVAFLESRSLEHGEIEGGTIHGIAFNVSKNWLIRKDIVMEFRFGVDGTLAAVEVKQVYTGP